MIVAEAPTANPAREDIAVAAFVLPNEPISNETKLTDFEVPIDALERSTGLELAKSTTFKEEGIMQRGKLSNCSERFL